MGISGLCLALVAAAGVLAAGAVIQRQDQAPQRWKIHDLRRPHPPVVATAALDHPVPPPSDAVVLFDGSGLDAWRSAKGGPARWKVADGVLISTRGQGDLVTARPFGDVQLHIEWAAPAPARGKGQGRGNSGVFLMGLYEVQILDSYESDTYADGQAASVYGQHPPLVNACHPPGEWQAYDIVFRRPRFHPDGSLERAALVTLFHNGVLAQDHFAIWGPTHWLGSAPYRLHPDKLPLRLQQHGAAVRFRNIWVRELDAGAPLAAPPRDEPVRVKLAPEILARYAGRYRPPGDGETVYTVTASGGKLRCDFYWSPAAIDLLPLSEREFALRDVAGRVVFALDASGRCDGLSFYIGEAVIQARRIQ